MKFTQGNLSRKEQGRLEQAKKVASLSDCAKMHGAVAEKGGRVIGVGVNSYRNSISVFDSIPDDARSEHAEEACVRALGDNARGATLYVARVNRLGYEMMSRPCNRCTILLRKVGIKRVVYTVDSSLDLN